MRLMSAAACQSVRRALYTAAAAVAALTPAVAADHAVAIMYHRFGEDRYPSTSIRLQQFEAHLQELSTGGYTVLPLSEVMARIRSRSSLPDRAVVITLDDAFRSAYAEAWPRLQRAGFPFTLFVATETLDARGPDYMSWDQVRELKRAGVEIAAHTRRHRHMVAASDQENVAEIAHANSRLEAELGEKPRFFAYPYGEWSAKTRELVIKAGYAAAFGQHSGVIYPDHDLFSLPRFAFSDSYGDMERFRRAVSALPLPISDLTPADPLLVRNPPAIGFTLAQTPSGSDRLACFASHQPGQARIERLGARRVEVRIEAPFPPGRGRINCTAPAPEGRWRWFSLQFYVPGS